MELNLQNREHAYMIGLLQTDGHHYESTRNRGRIGLELSEKDKDIVDRLYKLVDGEAKINERVRKTNFKTNSKTVILNIHSLSIRTQFKDYIPVGKKSDSIKMPDNISESDYWRGIIDGDGSLGLTNNLFPFISLVTKSESLANSFINYIEKITGLKKTSTRNKRDLAYNICLTKEAAQKLINMLYYENCLCMDRKREKANIAISWVRPDNMQKVTWERKKWTQFEDDFISTHTIDESIEKLNRTEKSIKIRLFRIKN